MLELFDPRRWIRLRNKSRIHLSLHTKIVIWFSLVLVIIGAMGIYLFEAFPTRSSWNDGILDALFQSITSRTARFNALAYTLGLTIMETGSLEIILFEELSAMGTAGLSLGLTPPLSSACKCIIVLSMLSGIPLTDEIRK